jgi:hypothetical protein
MYNNEYQSGLGKQQFEIEIDIVCTSGYISMNAGV